MCVWENMMTRVFFVGGFGSTPHVVQQVSLFLCRRTSTERFLVIALHGR